MNQKPVHVFIGRKQLTGYTNLQLKRSKNRLTGELNIDIFMGWIPSESVLPQASRGEEILVYVGGHLAFTGYIDRRRDSATGTHSLSIGKEGYSVKLSCRGKTRLLIDSSHQERVTTILRPKNKEVLETLVAPWNAEVQWEADIIDLDKYRLNDGARVVEELQRLAEQCSLFIFEGRDGALRVTDESNSVEGEPIVLSRNVLSFSTDQAADPEKSQVTVKGQRIEAASWGNQAVLDTLRHVKDATVSAFSPLTVQHYGNATEELLERRANYETNKRATVAKRITVEVFHVQQSTGEPWDIGQLHYVEIPPAGVFGVFEVADLTYTVGVDRLSTTLTLTPLLVKPKKKGSALESLPDQSSGKIPGRETVSGADDGFSDAWNKPNIKTIAPNEVILKRSDALSQIENANGRPPGVLPSQFQGIDNV